MSRACAIAVALAAASFLGADASGVIHRGTFSLSKSMFNSDVEQKLVWLGVFGYSPEGQITVTLTDTSPEGSRIAPGLVTGRTSSKNPGVGFLLFPKSSAGHDIALRDHGVDLCNETLVTTLAQTSNIDSQPKYIELQRVGEAAKATTSAPDTSAPAPAPAPAPPATDPPTPAPTPAPAPAPTPAGAGSRRSQALAEEPEVQAVEYRGIQRFTQRPGFWELVIYTCAKDESVRKSLVAANLKVSVIEKNGDSFLQVGDAILPSAYLVLSFAFLLALFKWVSWMKDNKQYLHKIHFLMALALVLKTGALLFESFRYSYYNAHGVMSQLYDSLYYTFTIFKGALVFSLVVLIGSGWSFLKPFLHDRDKKVLLIVIPLQIIITIIQIVIDEYTAGKPEKTMEMWQKIFTVLSFVCCVIVVAPILWSLKQLRSAQNADGKVARNLARLKQFRTVYFVVIVYIYFKTLVCEMFLAMSVAYTNTWVPIVLSELSVFMSFVYMGIKFRPMKENPYTHLDEDDFEEGGRALDQELGDMTKDKRVVEEGNEGLTVQGGQRSTTSVAEERDSKTTAPAATLAPAKRPAEADF